MQLDPLLELVFEEVIALLGPPTEWMRGAGAMVSPE